MEGVDEPATMACAASAVGSARSGGRFSAHSTWIAPPKAAVARSTKSGQDREGGGEASRASRAERAAHAASPACRCRLGAQGSFG